MGEPAVERGRRHRHVIAVPLGVLGQQGEVDVAVRGPVEVGIVEDERGAQRRRRPEGIRAHAAQEVHERQQAQAPARHQAVAQGLLGRQLARGHRDAFAQAGVAGPRARRRRGGPRAPPARSAAAARPRRRGRRSASPRRAVRRARPRAPAGRAPGGRRRPARRRSRRGTAGPAEAAPRRRREPARRARRHLPARAARSARKRALERRAAAAGARRTPPPARCRRPPARLRPSTVTPATERPQSAVEGAQRDVTTQRRAAAGDGLGRVAAHHRQGRDRARDDAAGVDHGAAPHRHVRQQQDARPDVGLVLDAHGHVARAHRLALLMGDDRRPRADLDAVADVHELGVRRLDDDVACR